MSTTRTHLIPTIAAAAVLAVTASAAVLAGDLNQATTTLDPSSNAGRGLSTPVLQLCPNPEPLFMEYGKGAVPYHPEMSVISLTGTVKNLGGKFVPGAAPQAIELWVNWGAGAGYKAKSIPLPTLQPGQVQTIQTSFDPADYKAKLQQYGATPKLTLIVNTNAAGPAGSKDCKLGEANIEWIYGPNAGELQAMGINS